jgi:hypothetical protein
MNQLVVCGSELGVSSERAQPCTINQTLRMFDPKSDAERFRLRINTPLNQHFKRIPCTVPQSKDDVVCFDLLKPTLRVFSDDATYLLVLNMQIDQLSRKPELSA